ncbi:MAG: glutamine synthetase, partial [Methanoregula sp.]
MSADVSKLLKKIEADDVKFIRLQFTDVPGIPKNAAIPADYAEKSLTEGTWFDGSSIEGFTRIEESDMLLKADPASYAVLPWRPQEGKV